MYFKVYVIYTHNFKPNFRSKWRYGADPGNEKHDVGSEGYDGQQKIR